VTVASRLAPTLPAIKQQSRRRSVGLLAASALALAVTATACGEATAKSIQVPDSTMTFVLPVEFTDLGPDPAGGLAYGLPGSSAVAYSSDPVVFMVAVPGGDAVSFHSLRLAATGNKFDPLDASLTTLPDNTKVIDYKEIIEPDVWGIRLKLVVGSGARDFQALVDRTTDQVVVSEVTCTQACFSQDIDLIQKIQGSWSLET
jgi:hypothetical protein